ncbi:MAG: 2-succinyl-6-hydroxy-2,4-cyclohexadiene-1-carboxylate synthase [Chloroflexota bacterium]
MALKTLNGINYQYRIDGEGEPLLLLHGFTGSHKTWTDIRPLLSQQYRLIMPDLLGHGLTDAPKMAERYTMQKVAGDLILLCELLRLERLTLLGYSMGGRLALYLATHFPNHFKAVILESSSPGLAGPAERAARKKRDNQLADRIENEGVKRFVDFWEGLPLWDSQKTNLTLAQKDGLHRQRLLNRSQGLANSLRGMGTGVQPSLWDQLHQVSMPVLLMTGALDQKFCKIAVEMALRFPRASHRTLDNVGHTLHLEAPEEYVDALLYFLNS